ncbi:lipoyl synthase [Thermodesulfovibrio sp.]|uniref:lipoyl synthase n=1 Tax=Thermodesulfovibrio sp. TaxID=2067987 RepID=UPI0030A061F9
MPLPEWVKTQIRNIKTTQNYLKNRRLNTVCETLRCPNRSFCYSQKAATFMILGEICTRGCKFCNAIKGLPTPVDKEEPARIAMAVKELSLKYVVITSPTRDDLKDGGAEHFAMTVEKIRLLNPNTFTEILVPDFKGQINAIEKTVNSDTAVFAHNIEVVKRLYGHVRDGDYEKSLKVLRKAKEIRPSIITKSGFMLGLGESIDEIRKTLEDLKTSYCDIVTVGQYLQPSKKALPVVEYIKPEVFDIIAELALEIGFKVVLSAPLVRSSTRAYEAYQLVKEGRYGKL